MKNTIEAKQQVLTPDVLLMRHGRTLANREGIHQGGDDPMDEHGEMQVESSAQNLAELILQGSIAVDRPWVVHYSPLPRAVHTKDIVVAGLQRALIGAGVELNIEDQVACPELAERLVNPEVKNKSYIKGYRNETHETWYQIYDRLVPYVERLVQERDHRQIFIVGHGGTNGILRLLLERGPEQAYAILENDSEYGVDPLNPKSSEWYTHKTPNAAIDLYRLDAETWSPLVQIRPEEVEHSYVNGKH